jgi:hypothetical protein
MTPRLRLNFLAVTPQQFTVDAWRMETAPDEKKTDEAGVWRYKLPEHSDAGSEGKTYLVRFTPSEGYVKFSVGSTVHRDLTKAALFDCLRTKVESILPIGSHFHSQKTFRPRRMYFVMAKHRVGRQCVWLEPYFLSASQQFGFLLDFRFVSERDATFNRDVQRLSLSLDSNYRSNKDFYIDRFEFVNRFLHEVSPKVFPISQADGASLRLDFSLAELPSERLSEKVYVFGDNHKSASQWSGLNSHGPFHAAPKPVRLVYAYRKFQRTLAEDLYRALDGKVPDFPFPGIKKLTGLTIDGYEKVEIADLSNAEIDAAVRQIGAISNKYSNTQCVLPIFISDKENSEAYYRLKLGLLKLGIPVQVVTAKLVGNRSSLKWSVANIALQIFSKAGGTAWRVQPSTQECLIFGIGQAHKKEGNRVHRYFAYSICTDSTGAYKRLSVLGEGADQTQYLEQLRRNIVTEVQAMSQQYKHCVIHIPFSIRQSEIEAINHALQTALNEKKLPAVDLSVIKVNMENKFFGYAGTNSLVPYAGSLITLSDDGEYLAWFDGLHQDREIIQRRIGGPVHIQWLWSSDESLNHEGRKRMLQDLLNLSGANWRGFNARSEPISVYYCELIARFTKNCNEAVDHIARLNSPWFL